MTKKYIKKHKFIIPLIFIGCSLTSCIVVPIECVNNDISLTKDLSQTSDSDVDFANLPLYYSDVTPNKFNTNKKIINDPSHWMYWSRSTKFDRTTFYHVLSKSLSANDHTYSISYRPDSFFSDGVHYDSTRNNQLPTYNDITHSGETYSFLPYAIPPTYNLLNWQNWNGNITTPMSKYIRDVYKLGSHLNHHIMQQYIFGNLQPPIGLSQTYDVDGNPGNYPSTANWDLYLGLEELGALGFSFKVKSKKDFYFKYRNENVFLRDALKDKTIDNDLLLTFSTPSPKLSKFNLTSVANQNAPIKISMVIPALAFLGTDEERNNLTWQQMCATADGPAQQPYVPIVGNVSFYEYKKPLLSLVGYYRYDVEFKTAFSFNESDGCFYAEQSLPSFALIYGGNEYDTGWNQSFDVPRSDAHFDDVSTWRCNATFHGPILPFLNPTNYFGRLDDIFSYKIQFKITPNVDILDNLYINSIVNEDGSTFATKCLKPEGINFGLSLSKIWFDNPYDFVNKCRNANIASGGDSVHLNNQKGYKLINTYKSSDENNGENFMNFTLFNKPEHSIPNISLGFVETICKSIKPHYSNIILDDNFFNVYDAGKRKLESIYFYQYIKAKLSFIPVQMLDKHIFEEMEATSLETLLKLTPKFPLSKINIYKNDDDFSVLNIGAVSNVYLFINLFDNEMGKVVGTMCILINHY